MKRMGWLLLMLLCMNGCAPSTADDHAVTPLQVWVGAQADIPWMEQVVRDFQAAHPSKAYDIRIGVQREVDAVMTILADAASAADVFAFTDDQLPALLAAGALLPLGEDAATVLNTSIPAAVAAVIGPDDQLYAYPAASDNGYFMFYNSAFITPGDAAALESILDRAAENGRSVAIPMANPWYLYSFFRGAGLEMRLSSDNITNLCSWNAVDTPITGTEVLSALLGIAAHPGFVEADSAAFAAGLRDGSIVAGISGTWNAALAAQVWGDHYAAAKLPTYRVAGRDVQMASFSGFKLVGVNAASPHAKDAAALAAFMTAYEAQMDRFRLRRQRPCNAAALASPEVQSEPAIAALAAQAPYADPMRVGSQYWDAAAALGRTIADGNPAHIPLQRLLDDAVASITAIPGP